MAPPSASNAGHAHFPSESLTIGAGVAIFHLSTARVVVCYHSRDKYWFLPKGRRNVNEDTGRAAEREGFEESGYRNRLLPLPMRHCQTDGDEGHEDFVVEPLWTELLPLRRTSQYILFWYAAETLPPRVERALQNAPVEAEGTSQSIVGSATHAYRPPPVFPKGLTLNERIKQDHENLSADGVEAAPGAVYEPVRYEGTGVDAEELLYESQLLPIEVACDRLNGTVMEDVIRRAWAAIQWRIKHDR